VTRSAAEPAPIRRVLLRAYTVAMVAAMLGILAVVGNSIRLLEDMTGNVEVAQRRAENLSNSQREMLRLLLAVTELAGAEQATDAMRTAVELRLFRMPRMIAIGTIRMRRNAVVSRLRSCG